ncbi:polymerase, partial [Campylobacter upsaliensis]|nr:polymerase [Campylobacter upsaliensis]
SATLFEEFVVERIYGNTRYKSFTGQKVDIFTNYEEARDFFEMMKKKKIKKGYG